MEIKKQTKLDFNVVVTMSKQEAERLLYALGHVTESDDSKIDSPLDILFNTLKTVDGLQ